MLVDPQSHTLIRNPQTHQSSPTYFTTISQGLLYRLLSREYKSYSTAINMWTVFWLFKTLISTCFIFIDNLRINSLIVIALTLLQSYFQTVLAWQQTKKINNPVFLCMFQLLICLLFILILVAKEIHFTIIPCLCFCLLVIFTTAIKVRNKRKIILLYFVLVHLAWVSLKFDNLIKITWQQVLLFLLPISIFSASALAFLVIYSSLLKYKYPEAYYIKKYSLIFLIVSFLGICALMSLIFSQVYFNLSLKITSFFSSSILSLVTMYLFIFKQEIVIAFCKHKQIVEQNQKQSKLQIVPQPKQKVSALYRYSSNWFGLSETIQQPSLLALDLPECIVCIQSKSEVVWLPCGHLALCSSCSEDMFQNQMFSCVLCKQMPTQICKFQTPSVNEVLMEREMGLTQMQNKHQKYSISAVFDIRVVK